MKIIGINAYNVPLNLSAICGFPLLVMVAFPKLKAAPCILQNFGIFGVTKLAVRRCSGGTRMEHQLNSGVQLSHFKGFVLHIALPMNIYISCDYCYQ